MLLWQSELTTAPLALNPRDVVALQPPLMLEELQVGDSNIQLRIPVIPVHEIK